METNFFYNPSRNKIGAIIRTTDAAERFGVIESAVDKLLSIEAISLISIMFYKPEAESELRRQLAFKYGKEKKRIEFVNVYSGNFYSDLLNYSIKEQTRRGIDYSLSVSPEAYEYISKENFEKIVFSIKNGALAVGLKIDEYSEIINQGYFSNVFAIYRNTAINFADIWDIHSYINNDDTKDISFGMEELYAIKRLLEVYGPGSVEIVTPKNGSMNYENHEKAREWKDKVLKTKIERLKKMQSMLKINPDEFRKMIIWV